MNVHVLRHDTWALEHAMTLVPGDIFLDKKTAYTLIKSPEQKEGNVHLSAKPLDSGLIAIAIEGETPGHVIRAMDMCNADLTTFDDGTSIIAVLDSGPGYIFSPRLALDELERFCKENLATYQAHLKKNRQALDAGETVIMEPFWPAKSPEQAAAT